MQMSGIYQQAIDGSLKSKPSPQAGPVTFTNQTCVPLSAYLVDFDGARNSGYNTPGVWIDQNLPLLPVEGSWTRTDPGSEWYWLFTHQWSGAFVAACKTPTSGSMTITSFDLLDPNDIGDTPEPSKNAPIPSDQTRIMVGCGSLGNGNSVVREQYWQRLPDSYSIGPGESKTVSSTVTSGMQQTTSDLKTVEASVAGSTSAGWGPVSASISASLSASATSFQQVTTTTQMTSYVSDEYGNTSDTESEMYLYWQLTDSMTVYDPNGVALSSIVTGTQPVVITGPYFHSNKPAVSRREEDGVQP